MSKLKTVFLMVAFAAGLGCNVTAPKDVDRSKDTGGSGGSKDGSGGSGGDSGDKGGTGGGSNGDAGGGGSGGSKDNGNAGSSGGDMADGGSDPGQGNGGTSGGQGNGGTSGSAAGSGGGSAGSGGGSAGSGGSNGAAGSGGADANDPCNKFCAALFKLASTCEPDAMCTISGTPASQMLCNGNGVKQQISTMEDEDTGAFTQTVKVLKAGGATCYTIDVMGDDDGTTRTWKDPTGAVIATGKGTADGESITCGGTTSDIPDDANCPWVNEGPDDGDCMDGTCN